MRTMTRTIGFALVTLFLATAAFAQCEISCNAECRQEGAICIAAANLEARIGRHQCATDDANALIVCDIEFLDARDDCVGLCGVDLKECGGAAKVAFKQCKEAVKIELAGCQNGVATLLAADKAACAEDATDCASGCVE